MSFQRIPNISVDGNGGQDGRPLFNGYIYNVDYNVTVGNEGSSTVNISLISEDGTYTVASSDLNLSRVYSISIGSNINLTMYLKSYKKTESPSGKILELQFIDGSFVLDRSFIGLYKRHGSQGLAGSDSVLNPVQQFGSVGCVMTLGIEHNPCQRDYIGSYDNVLDIPDPCNPCANLRLEEGVAHVNCKNAAKYDIQPVGYNFSMLVSLLGGRGFGLLNASDPNPKYYADYTGTIRDVLSKWCADFGWIFFWDNGVIIFRDLRTVINVNATIEQFCPNLEATDEEATLEGTVSTVIITNFSRSGKGKTTYSCQNAEYFTLFPLVKGSFGIGQNVDESGAAWSVYSPVLRTLYYFYSKYDGNVSSGVTMPELGLTILSNKIPIRIEGAGSAGEIRKDSNGEIIPFLNVIDATLKPIQDSIRSDPTLSACFQSLNPKDQWDLLKNSDQKYFFIASHEEDVENGFMEEERDYASGFWGKFFALVPSGKFWENEIFVRDSNCAGGGFVNDGRVSFEALDPNGATITIFDANPGEPRGVADLPFGKFITTPVQVLGRLVTIERDVSWSPPPGSKSDPTSNADTLAVAASYLPKKIIGAGNGLAISTVLNDSTVNTKNIYLFLAVENPEIHGTRSLGYNGLISPSRPFSGKPLNFDPLNQETEVVYQYPDLKCQPVGSIGVGQASAFNLSTPAGVFTVVSPPGTAYSFIIEKTIKSLLDVQKVETVMQAGSCPGDQTLSLSVNYKPISGETISDITRMPSGPCVHNLSIISAIHANYVRNLSLNQSVPLIKKSFTVAGIDIEGPAPTINDGLQSIQVKIDEGGIKSTYVFGTTKMLIPQKDDVYLLGLSSATGPNHVSDTTGWSTLYPGR